MHANKSSDLLLASMVDFGENDTTTHARKSLRLVSEQVSRRSRTSYVIVISLSTVEYTSVSRVYSTVDSDITNLIHGLVDCLERRLVVDG